jgi:hypothetical protein
MSFGLASIAAMAPVASCVVAAAYLATTGFSDWYWFLIAAPFCGASVRHRKDEAEANGKDPAQSRARLK